MAALHYITNLSLDGYIEDAQGNFDFSNPNDEQFAFITDLIRPVGTFLYGRRLYESMAVWETDPSLAAMSDAYAEFAHAWQDSDKVVYSTTLHEVATQRTRIERAFDADAVRAIKDAATADLTVGGAAFARECFLAGLVDETHLFVASALLGGGKTGLPTSYRGDLELVDVRRFDSIVYLRHIVSS